MLAGGLPAAAMRCAQRIGQLRLWRPNASFRQSISSPGTWTAGCDSLGFMSSAPSHGTAAIRSGTLGPARTFFGSIALVFPFVAIPAMEAQSRHIRSLEELANERQQRLQRLSQELETIRTDSGTCEVLF
mmetsp:Transcript_8431/g.18382  ORF Transcript_8431/g.18382 Transcript_8431/m.18382 type:complete len:130 (+) Transcript_8431:37-426(+)